MKPACNSEIILTAFEPDSSNKSSSLKLAQRELYNEQSQLTVDWRPYCIYAACTEQ